MPPFRQGLDEHSSISTLHLGPEGEKHRTLTSDRPAFRKKEGREVLILTSKARLAHTVIPVDTILTDTIVTRVAGTVIKVDLTVGACIHNTLMIRATSHPINENGCTLI